jgi:hypothetical protein
MARIAKILPLPVNFKQGEMTMQNALAEKGYMRHPGTGIGIVPIQGLDGKYLTGLDPEANYIRRMRITNPEAAEKEAKVVRERKERLEAATGIELGPRSEYYSGVYGSKFNTGQVASRVKLVDGDNTFNFSNPHKEIEYWWLTQITDLIAPSIEEWKRGICKSTVQFYISNPEAEASIVYEKNMTIAKAIESLKVMSVDRQRKVAKLIGLPITDNDKPEIVFNQLFIMLNNSIIDSGDYKGQNSIDLFNKIASMTDKILTVKSLVKEALHLRVFSKRQGIIYEGSVSIAQSEDELVNDLSLESKQMERLALETRVADKKKVKSSIENFEYLAPQNTPTETTDEPAKKGRKKKGEEQGEEQEQE